MKAMARSFFSSGMANSGRSLPTGFPPYVRSYGRSLSKRLQTMPRRTVLRHATELRKASAAHRNYPHQCGGGLSRILHVLQRQQWRQHERASVELQHAPLLKVNNIEVVYDHVILVLKGVSLE